MNNIKFLKTPQSYNPKIAFVAHLSGISNKKELFKELSDKLLFPSYFGSNWDALSDCLRDLSWIEQHMIVLVHEDCPKLDRHELRIYLQVLIEAVRDWEESGEHLFEVVFSDQDRDLINITIENT